MKKRITSILLIAVMLIGMTSFSAFAADGATGKYHDAAGAEQDIPQMIKWAEKEANPLYPVPVIWGYKDFERLIDRIRR